MIVNQHPLYILKHYLTNDNPTTFCMILKKSKILEKDWNFFSIKIIINILTKANKAQDLIDLIQIKKKFII